MSSISFQTLGLGGLLVVASTFAYEGKRHMERGAQHQNACEAGPQMQGDGGHPPRTERWGEQACACRHWATSPPARLCRKSPQRGTFIMLKARSWAQGKHLFQGLCHNRMTVSIHQPQSQRPAQLDRTFLCDRDWRDVTSAHTTGPAGPHTAHVHPAAKQTQKRAHSMREESCHLPGGKQRGVGSLKILCASWCGLRVKLPSLGFTSSESRSCWSRRVSSIEWQVRIWGGQNHSYTSGCLRRLSWPPVISPCETVAQQWLQLLLLFSCPVVSSSFATPWTAARQAPLSMEFSRQEYWSGLPCPPSRGSSRPRDWTHIS